MRSFPAPLLLAALGALLALSAPVPIRAAAAGSVVVLPAFEVKDMRPWFYAQVPGLEMLSLTSERETQNFARHLQDMAWLTPLLLPPGVDRTLTPPSYLFLRHFAGNAMAAKIRPEIGSSTLASFSIFWDDVSITFPTEDTSRAWGAGRDFLGIDFLRVAGLIVPHVPIWYRDGMGDLLRSATGSVRSVNFPSRTWYDNTGQSGMSPVLNPTADPKLPTMPVAELLAVQPAPGSLSYRQKSVEDRQRYLRGATLFTHWGFFDNGGKRRAAFLELVGEARRGPPDEATVKRLLGFTFKELQTRLDRYAEGARGAQILAPKDLPLLAPALARAASRSEVARIVGEAYLRLADTASPADAATYLDNARELLNDAWDSGETDPGVLLQLGMLAAASKEEDKAIEWLQRAVDADIQRPSAYVALAGLRLKHLADVDPGASLSASDTAAVWALLKKADAMRPRIGNTYSLGLAMWQNSSVRPKAEDLALLADGVDAFPRGTALMRDALRLFNKLGVGVDPAIEARMNEWRNRLGVPGLTPATR